MCTDSFPWELVLRGAKVVFYMKFPSVPWLRALLCFCRDDSLWEPLAPDSSLQMKVQCRPMPFLPVPQPCLHPPRFSGSLKPGKMDFSFPFPSLQQDSGNVSKTCNKVIPGDWFKVRYPVMLPNSLECFFFFFLFKHFISKVLCCN